MYLKYSKIPTILLLAFSLNLLCSCYGDDERENGLVNIFLVDAPGDFDEVWVEVLGVEVVPGSGETIMLDYIPANKMVNVSNLVGEAALLVGRGRVPIGELSQMTLILGDELYVQRQGSRFNMEFASPENRRIPFNTTYNIVGGVSYDLYIDIDLARSVNRIGDIYTFEPVARAFSNQNKGILRGIVKPNEARPHIFAISGRDTLTTLTTADGSYFFRGLSAGSYRIVIQPMNPFLDSVFVAPIRIDTLNRVPDINLRRRPSA